MPKYPAFSCTIFSTKTGRGPVTLFWPVRHIEKKIVWAHAYSIQNKSCKNNQPFLCNNFATEKGRGLATPFWAVRHA